MKSIEILGNPTVGQKNIADTWTTSTIGISHTAPWHHRHRYESAITLVRNDDDDREAGPTRARRDFEPTTKINTSLRQEQGRQNSSIPKNERMRQRTFDEEFRAELEWMSQDWKTFWSQPSSSSSSASSQKWWHHERQDSLMARTPRHSMARSPMTRSPMATRQVVKRVMATDSLQILRGSHCARFLRIRRFVHRFRVQTLPYVVHATVGEDRTLRRTHIFQSRVVSRMPEHIKTRAHVCGLRLDDPCHRVVCCLVAHPKSFHLIACFTEHLSVFLTPSHHSVPHHHRLHPLHDRCLESGVLPVLTSLEGRQSIWPEHFLTQDLATQWIQSYPCKPKTFQETEKSLRKFLEPSEKPNVIYIDNALEFGKSCEDVSWNHRTSTRHRSETNGVVETAVRRVKEGTLAVLLQSGLDGGLILWNAIAICETSKTFCQMGKLLTKGDSENHFAAQQFILVQWFNLIRFLHETKQGFTNLARMFCQ